MPSDSPKITLRAVEPQDVDIIFEIDNDVEAWADSDMSAPYSRALLAKYADGYMAEPFEEGQLRLIAEDKESREVVGILDYYEISALHLNAMTGIYVRPAFRRKGYGRAMLEAAKSYASRHLHLIMLGARILQDNSASVSLFSKTGFSCHGIMPNWHIADGEARNVLNFYVSLPSIVRSAIPSNDFVAEMTWNHHGNAQKAFRAPGPHHTPDSNCKTVGPASEAPDNPDRGISSFKKNDEDTLELKCVASLFGNNFYIPFYQRGYRWTPKQIIELLDDFEEYYVRDDAGDFYCLQQVVSMPISDKKKIRELLGSSIGLKNEEIARLENENWFEIIDGQQRITTIRLISAITDSLCKESGKGLYADSSAHDFGILYASRPEMYGIFNSIRVVHGTSNGEYLLADLHESSSLSIDGEYLRIALHTILDWILAPSQRKDGNGRPIDRLRMLQQLLYTEHYIPNGRNTLTMRPSAKSVQFVWYQVASNKNPHKEFNTLNDKKINLSCSELIRSLFLSSETHFTPSSIPHNLNDEQKKLFSDHNDSILRAAINDSWDHMEHTMRSKSLQNFATPRSFSGRNAIEMLFDFISGKYAGGNGVAVKILGKDAFGDSDERLRPDDPQYTYLYFKRLIDHYSDNAWKVWGLVVECFDKLTFWHSDRDLYHQIGFLNLFRNAKVPADSLVCELLGYHLGQRDFRNAVTAKVAERISIPAMDEEGNIPRRPIPDKPGLRERVDRLFRLNYENPTHSRYILRILALYNVETARRDPGGKFFSFENFRYFTNAEGIIEPRHWTLEHIHARKSDLLPRNNVKVWLDWIKENAITLKTLHTPFKDIEEGKQGLTDSLSAAMMTEEEFKSANPECRWQPLDYTRIGDLFNKVSEFYDVLEARINAEETRPDAADGDTYTEYFPIHLIDKEHGLCNLTLLDKIQNSALSNHPFETKRRMISEICRKGESYLPPVTVKAFTKLFDPSGEHIHLWSHIDRKGYLLDLMQKLSYYTDYFKDSQESSN